MFRDLEDDMTAAETMSEFRNRRQRNETMGVTTVLSAEEEREAVYRHVFMGWPMKQVGNHFGVSGSTISRVVSHYRNVNTGTLERQILREFGHL